MLTPVKSAGNKEFFELSHHMAARKGKCPGRWEAGRQAGRYYCCLEGWSRSTAGRSVGVAAVVDSWQEGKKLRTHHPIDNLPNHR